MKLRLHSFWRSPSAWRVRIALALEGLEHEYAAVHAARRLAVDLAPFPTLRRVEEACAALPVFRVAYAHRRPDTPSEWRER